jgi:hypothetical protein
MPAWLVPAALATAGFVLLIGGRALSLRYNAFTTRFREKNPHINPPPTPEMREKNTAIMTRVFRVCGAMWLVFGSFLLLGSLVKK